MNSKHYSSGFIHIPALVAGVVFVVGSLVVGLTVNQVTNLSSSQDTRSQAAFTPTCSSGDSDFCRAAGPGETCADFGVNDGNGSCASGQICCRPAPTGTTYTCGSSSSGHHCESGSSCEDLNRYDGTGTCPSGQVCCGATVPAPTAVPTPTPTPTPTPMPKCTGTCTGVACTSVGLTPKVGVCDNPQFFCCNPATPAPTARPTTAPTATPIPKCTGTCTGVSCTSVGLTSRSGVCDNPQFFCCNPATPAPTARPTTTPTPSPTPNTNLKANYATCNSNNECQSNNCQSASGGKFCLPATVNVSTPVAAGGACGTTAYNRECQSGLICSSNHTCIQPKSNYQSCGSNSDCASHNCQSAPGGSICMAAGQTATVTVAAGGTCNTTAYDRQCVTGYTCQSNRCQPVPTPTPGINLDLYSKISGCDAKPTQAEREACQKQADYQAMAAYSNMGSYTTAVTAYDFEGNDACTQDPKSQACADYRKYATTRAAMAAAPVAAYGAVAAAPVLSNAALTAYAYGTATLTTSTSLTTATTVFAGLNLVDDAVTTAQCFHGDPQACGQLAATITNPIPGVGLADDVGDAIKTFRLKDFNLSQTIIPLPNYQMSRDAMQFTQLSPRQVAVRTPGQYLLIDLDDPVLVSQIQSANNRLAGLSGEQYTDELMTIRDSFGSSQFSDTTDKATRYGTLMKNAINANEPVPISQITANGDGICLELACMVSLISQNSNPLERRLVDIYIPTTNSSIGHAASSRINIDPLTRFKAFEMVFNESNTGMIQRVDLFSP